MKTEAQTIEFLQSISHDQLSTQEVSDYLKTNGFLRSDGHCFSVQQTNSLIHSANQLTRKATHKRQERCGIDREANPCGDASDY